MAGLCRSFAVKPPTIGKQMNKVFRHILISHGVAFQLAVFESKLRSSNINYAIEMEQIIIYILLSFESKIKSAKNYLTVA